MKPSIILYKVSSDDLLHRLEEYFTVTQVPNLYPEAVAQRVGAFANAEGPLGSSEAVNIALLEKMPKLCTTSTISVGYGNLDVDILNVREVLLTRIPIMLTETVTDTVMTLALSTARRVVEIAERVKAGEWTKSVGPDQFGTDVHYRTLGIVGMDRIGLALVQRAYPGFNMPILYSVRRHYHEIEKCFNVRYCNLGTLLQESDFVCLIPPLTDETHYLFSTERSARMRSSAIFINTRRSPMVDGKALIATLQKDKIHTVSLDVLEQEPLSVNSPLLLLSNAVAVPHIGSAMHEIRYNMTACAVDSLIDALQGRVGRNYADPQAVS